MKAFPRDSHLTAIAIAYKNQDVDLIADEVLPRVTVGLKEFKWSSYKTEEMYTLPNTRMTERGEANVVTVEGQRLAEFCEDEGVFIPVTNAEKRNADRNFDPEARATERGTGIITLVHEEKVAKLAFDAAQYPSTNKLDLTSGSNKQVTDPTSDPLRFMLEGIESCLLRPNRVCIGGEVWTKLRVHPKLVSAAHGNSGKYGAITQAQLAELLEVNQIVVGRSRLNIKKPGETPVIARAWGNAMLAYYVDSSADTSGGVTFGYTAEYGKRDVHKEDRGPGRMGREGGMHVFVSESVKPLIVAPRAAFLWTNAANLG